MEFCLIVLIGLRFARRTCNSTRSKKLCSQGVFWDAVNKHVRAESPQSDGVTTVAFRKENMQFYQEQKCLLARSFLGRRQ